MSVRFGASILMTSAPKSESNAAESGPAIKATISGSIPQFALLLLFMLLPLEILWVGMTPRVSMPEMAAVGNRAALPSP